MHADELKLNSRDAKFDTHACYLLAADGKKSQSIRSVTFWVSSERCTQSKVVRGTLRTLAASAGVMKQGRPLFICQTLGLGERALLRYASALTY